MTIKHTVTTTLDLDTEYKWRVRYKGTNYGWSEWSDFTNFTTLNCTDYDSASDYTRSDNFCGAIGEDVIKVNSTMGVAPSDQSSTYTWNGTSTGNCQGTIGSSWYCPNLSQLQTLYSNRSGINGAADNNFISANYWSSTEYDSYRAYFVDFINGTTNGNYKTLSTYVRCVRSF